MHATTSRAEEMPGAGAPDRPALDAIMDGALVGALLKGLSATQAGICLCDQDDRIRYVNDAFRSAFFPDLAGLGAGFVEAIAAAIIAGRGIKLQSMPLDTFVPRVRARRRAGAPRYDFTADTTDGRWWAVNDLRLDNGWILVVASDISVIKREEFRLRDAHEAAVRAAETDALTGLPNRRAGLAWLDAALTQADADRLPLAVALLDIDHFKRINDTHGHDAGDDVLVHFATALKTWAGGREHVSRIGGEEFLVVMPGMSDTRAAWRLERLLGGMRPLDRGAGRHPLCYSFSAGVVEAHPREAPKALLSRADAALYAAKSRGRGRVEVGVSSLSSVA